MLRQINGEGVGKEEGGRGGGDDAELEARLSLSFPFDVEASLRSLTPLLPDLRCIQTLSFACTAFGNGERKTKERNDSHPQVRHRAFRPLVLAVEPIRGPGTVPVRSILERADVRRNLSWGCKSLKMKDETNG